MKKYKNKISKIINFIKNEGKFDRTDFVVVLANKTGQKGYDKYIGKKGIVTNIDYTKEYCVGVKFENRDSLDFMPEELKKLTWEEEMSEEYKKLLHMI